jgi:predicted transcriptional regulator/transcriptional regulator with XRE-family HTH domain
MQRVRTKLFIGPQLRRVREEKGLTQAALARLISISPSYLNQIERNQRPLTVSLLLRLGTVLDFDVRNLSEDEEARLVADIDAALTDPVAGVQEAVGADEIRDLMATQPAIARALVSLHRRATDARRRVEEMAIGLGGRASDASSPVMPYEEVLDFVHDRRNHFAELDLAAEDMVEQEGLVGEGFAAGLERLLAERHDVRTVISADLGDRRRYDRANRLLILERGLDEGRRAFQMATQYAYLEHGQVLERLTDVPGLSSGESRALARIGLANYFAGAVLLPYRAFLGAAEELGYDIGLLSDRFGVSIETICHRLSTLQRPGEAGVPLIFVRVDRAGNISKRHSATDFHFSRIGGTCPLWSVYEAFSSPGRIIRQVAQMPDGRTYLWVARTIARRIGGYGAPGVQFAVGLGCDVRHAPRLVYSRGLALDDPATAVPIGPGCRLCERVGCPQRALPLLGRELDIDEDRARTEPYPAR